MQVRNNQPLSQCAFHAHNSFLDCRFGSCHISEKNCNVVNPELWEKHKIQHYSNSLAKEVQQSLWKHKYNFEKSEEALRHVAQAKTEANEVKPAAIGPVIDRMDQQKSVSCPFYFVTFSNGYWN